MISTPGGAGGCKTRAQADAELAELYTACPLAAVIDWQTVAQSPEKAEALLPPYRETADHVPYSADDVDVPRIRYPVRVEVPEAGIRIAQLPQAKNIVSSGPLLVAENQPKPASPPPPANGKLGDWLIDPSEWLTPSGKPVEPAASTAKPTPAQPQPSAAAGGLEKAETPSPQPTETKPSAPPPSALPEPSKTESALPLPSQPPAAAGGLEKPTPPVALPSPPQAPASPPPAPPIAPPPRLPTTPTQPPAPSPEPPIFTPPPKTETPTTIAPQQKLLPQPPAAAGGLEKVAPPSPTSSPQSPTPSPSPPAPTIFSPPPATEAQPAAAAPAKPAGPPPDVDPHLELFTKNAYPSARECAVCHEEVYNQWSVSAHAYAAVSPMFNKFEQRLNDLSQGTVGYFCLRCHSPVGVSLCLPRDLPLWKQPEAAREGITCVACHRVQFAYGKSNGERRVEQGDIYAPVFGGIGGDGVAAAIERKSDLKLKTSADDKGPGQNMHIAGVYFQPLTRSEFCTPCHQVAVHPGIKLEVVWEQYRASPACKKGIQCQDCHMGRVPGMPLGYECGPVAKISGKTVNDNRKKSNHMFHGPNYSIAHPGVFPFHLKANRWTMEEWLTFDWRAGWGTKEFEDAVEDGKIKCEFPPKWAEADDRLDAREILDDNFKKLQLKRENRIQVMENGSRVEGPFFESTLCRGQELNLHYLVTNTNEGHNLLTASLGAQPQLWANVVLIGPDGRRLWETGYVDSVGDVANIHSQDVRKGRLAFDWQLFNLQTMFLTTGVKGTDREFYVPVNFDIDQIPFIRPGTQPISTINHPPFIRMESQSLAATGSRRVPYRIPGELLQQPGRYRLSFRMRSRSEPIYFMQFCFATDDMQRSMNENMIDIHPLSVEFDVR